MNIRLLTLIRPARTFIVIAAVIQVASVAFVVGRGLSVGFLVAGTIEHWPDPMPHVGAWAAVLVISVVGVSAMAWVQRWWSATGAGPVITDVRSRTLTALNATDPRVVQENSSRWKVVLGAGPESVEGLRPYLSAYIPAALSSGISTPIVLAVIALIDVRSALLAAATLVLIPIFMILIGTLTRDQTQQRLHRAHVLDRHIIDLLRGARTLQEIGDTSAAQSQVHSSGRRHAAATMSVLRLAFLSSFALEFVATLSVALVAVSIGVRLVDSSMTLHAGLIALILAPEVYNPLRAVGTAYHSSADGMTAVETALDLIESTPQTANVAPLKTATVVSDGEVSVDKLSVHGRDGTRPHNLSFQARPGEVTALIGSNGCGKSTTLLAIMGMINYEGTIAAPHNIGYLPARPALCTGTLADNLSLLGPRDRDTAGALLRTIGCDIPLSRTVTYQGEGLSSGQIERLAFARTCSQECAVYLFDEPTAHVDPETARKMWEHIRSLARDGATVIVATHDLANRAYADQVIVL
ncbi:ATP-binding cassette domain-containing protein [Corynebacterium diphtheriae bv. mitis]|uniref:ABC transporter ATP-binding protein/permease n=1 Tax=Corynebacterium diphtheriae TaxID=1717 RepID=UPI00064CBF47|nr:ATP-binding cassette domain-containing protein [Corynebacterium diphtheriae]OWN10094.1 ABC transporter ATP-binding protein [Corynebacterium belfantii]KLN38096.1 ABC transporter permease [Corynebacterium diphtheriae bv. gravis str. ISS 4060]MBG9263039.1 ATP-binding cassette domain-containing protein [Corynebacterium diphtheriae bv. gravis]MBG9358959.1 ATP-binding cassette domain-containing protein [Corynebacterium diphtheriae bv. mitis]MBG9361960.1 ATP-binding cassette domain-containing prot